MRVCMRVFYRWTDVKSPVGCDLFLCVRLSELMAAVWINGFVNGQEATGRVYSVSIYKSQQYAGKLNQTAEREGEGDKK